MIPKAAAKHFTAFIVTGVLLVASDSFAFRQRDKGRSERQSPVTHKLPEELSQDALLVSDTHEHRTGRLRLQQAMPIWMQRREPGKAAKAALQVGHRYKQARKYLEALDHFKQALEVPSLPGLVKAHALNAIAQVYAELYQSDLARHYFSQALDQARTINDLPAQTLALTGLANLYHGQGEKAKALACVARARQSNTQKHAETEAALQLLLGHINQEEGRVEKAKAAFENALAIYEKAFNTAGQVKALCALSTLSLLDSQKQAALDQSEQAVAIAEKQATRAVSHADVVNARELRWHAWLSRARAERALGQKESALKSYFWARSQFKAIWWAVYLATEASAIALREESQATYRECVDLLMEQGEFEKAYELADEPKARTILNRIESRRAKPSSGDRRQEATRRELSRNLARRRLQLRASRLSRLQKVKLQKDIEEADLKMVESRVRAELEHSKERLVWSQPATTGQLQQETAHSQTALVQFSLGENRSFVWLFARGEVFFNILPPRKKVEEAVRLYLDMLAAPPSQLYIERDLARLREESGELFDTLFGGLSRQIEPGRRLIVVPDGLLHYLPFEALIHNGHYLVEDHEISYLPSASMLMQRQDSRGEAGTADRMELIAFGDPIFGLELKASITKTPGSDTVGVIRNSRASRIVQLPPLPKTRDEVQFIASLFPPDRTRLYLDKASTEDAVKREPLRRYRRLHFATHSLIDEKSPSRSAVVLTQDADPDEDGFLEVSEISELDLDCDIVVLSACQTGRGQLLSGEGIVGLSRAFFYAGARALVVSFWNVNDISTGQLMEGFYRHLTAGIGNAAALRQSKLQMLKSDKETRHPYYWASFVIIGKP